jgi:hypothetical protein
MADPLAATPPAAILTPLAQPGTAPVGEKIMAKQTTKHMFTFDGFNYTLDAVHKKDEPLTIRFHVEKMIPGTPNSAERFWVDKPFPGAQGIAFIETDALILREFQEIERLVRNHQKYPPEK